MRSDRMATVLRVRELVERRRLAERAAALREAESSRTRHDAAIDARARAVPAPGTSLLPAQLASVRLGALALDDVVTHAVGHVAQADRGLALADQALLAAAVERRSAERLRDRRAAAADAQEARHEQRRADDVALQQWRSRS